MSRANVLRFRDSIDFELLQTFGKPPSQGVIIAIVTMFLLRGFEVVRNPTEADRSSVKQDVARSVVAVTWLAN